MSVPLARSFNHLKVTAPPSTIQRVQVALPKPAADGRVCFYGYAVSTEWLIDFATTHWSNAHWGGIEKYDDVAKATAAIHLLTAYVGIKSLTYECAFKDHTAPLDVVAIPGRPGEVRLRILSNFSNEVSSFKRRPSQEQVDRLSQIMGKQPRWWVDYDDPRSYEYD